jgi:hypothetical protein
VTWQLSWRIAIGCTCMGVAAWVALSCELVVAPGALQDGACGAGRKVCKNPSNGVDECVGLDDPDFQCAATSCSPCSLPHAIPICASGSCAIGSCAQVDDPQGDIVEEWRDCDVAQHDGCEVDILHGTVGANGAVENCGACGTTCAAPNTLVNGCMAGSCVIDECAAGFVECGDDARSGCVLSGACDGG